MVVLLQRFTLHRTVFVWYRCTSDGDLYIQVEGKMKLDYDQKSEETRELLKSSERREVALTSTVILVDLYFIQSITTTELGIKCPLQHIGNLSCSLLYRLKYRD